MPVEESMRSTRVGSMASGPSKRALGDEPMTALQAYNLKTLSEQAREPEAYCRASKAEAARRINSLEAKLWLAGEPPHTA
jgi:hypothetical protein